MKKLNDQWREEDKQQANGSTYEKIPRLTLLLFDFGKYAYNAAEQTKDPAAACNKGNPQHLKHSLAVSKYGRNVHEGYASTQAQRRCRIVKRILHERRHKLPKPKMPVATEIKPQSQCFSNLDIEQLSNQPENNSEAQSPSLSIKANLAANLAK